MLTFRSLWQRLTPLYDDHEAAAIVRLVLETRFTMTYTDIVCGGIDSLTDENKQELETFMHRLETGEPVQYVLGEEQFMGRTFHIEPGVLIPRPETAELCQWIIGQNRQACDILDIGCGSGCIGVTLAAELSTAHVSAWDVSETALRLTAENAHRLGTTVCTRRQDALQPPPDEQYWDVIVSNPPYICMKEQAGMEPNVLDHEPSLALFVPDDNPLLFYRAIARYAYRALRPGGKLYFEINPIYAQETLEMLQTEGFGQVEIRNDEFGKKRMICCKAPAASLQRPNSTAAKPRQ
uniref:peptide chain release factor N(5)-glutamine methyltransferase n=1 Tax=Prevotella sp. GTC17262 TaxID=3236797 RepID=A0AB33JKQ2_9BACT